MVILLKNEHPITVVREGLIFKRMRLRVLQQILAHALDLVNDLRVNRGQTQHSVLGLELFKPLTDHRLWYLVGLNL